MFKTIVISYKDIFSLYARQFSKTNQIIKTKKRKSLYRIV